MPKRSVALISELLQSQHGTVTAVCERGLEEFENLEMEMESFNTPKYVFNQLLNQSLEFEADLLQDILLSHQFLSFPVGFVNHDLQNILPTVGDVHHKENQILQELGHEPEECASQTQTVKHYRPLYKQQLLQSYVGFLPSDIQIYTNTIYTTHLKVCS